MSFILDALRKSEHERRMETAPDIMHSPAAVAKTSLPLWAIALMGALAVALVAVSGFSLSQRFGGTQRAAPDAVPPRQAVAAPPQVEAAPVAAPQVEAQTVTGAPTQSQRAAPDTVNQPDEPAAAATEAAETPAPAAVTPAPQPAPAAAVTPPRPALDVRDVPSYAAAIAEGASLPALQMQLHVHSSTPSSRFVVVNGSRLREGDRTNEGANVEAIVPEGVVLNYQGRRFLLTPN